MSRLIAKNNSYGKRIDSFSTLDFSKITIEQLGKILESTINKKTPMFLWSRRRQNEKIELDNDKQLLIIEKIQGLRAIGNELINLKAGAIFDAEYINLLVADKRMLAQQYFEKTIAAHNLSISTTISDIKLINAKIEHDLVELDRKRAENERIRIENDKIKSEVTLSDTKISIINKLLVEADFNHLTTQQTFLLHVFLGADPSQFTRFELEEELKEIVKQEKQAEANKKDAEADNAKTEAQSKKWKDEQAKKDAGL